MRAGNGILKTVIVCAAAFVAAAQSPEQNGEKLVNGNDCTGCHSPDSQGAGPSWKAIARRYAGQAGAPAKLSAKIRAGGSGTWGDVAMTPHPDVTDAQGRQMVAWILTLKDAAPAAPAGPSKTYSYKPKNGPAVQLDFAIFAAGTSGKVTKDIFRGYELFNSYCYRCHGTDATGSEIGPDLRHSLAGGMTQQQFIAIAMAGRKDKGMPSWAGFLSKQEVTQTYQYTKGRSLDLIAPGRPPE